VGVDVAPVLDILLLAGGDSPERDVSLTSCRGIAAALREAGHRVRIADPARPEIAPTDHDDTVLGTTAIGVEPPTFPADRRPARAAFTQTLTRLRSQSIDIVFNGLHGGAGEDGTIQAILHYLGMPYTGSGPAASALAMDKQRSKIIAAAEGVPVPKGLHFNRSALAVGTLEVQVRETLGLPIVVKPNAQGSSVGLTVANDFAELDAAAARAFEVDDSILIESFIAGRELTHAIIEDGPDLPVLEIRPKSGLYDYFHKYQSGNTEYLVPAPIEDAVARRVRESSQRAFDALGLSVYTRFDYRLDASGKHFMLEANTLPGMTPMSLVPKSAAAVGISYVELCDRIVRRSLARFR